MNGGRLSVSTKHIAKEENSGIRIISTIKKYWFIYLLAIPGFCLLFVCPKWEYSIWMRNNEELLG